MVCDAGVWAYKVVHVIKVISDSSLESIKEAGLARTWCGSVLFCNIIPNRDMLVIFGTEMYETSLI